MSLPGWNDLRHGGLLLDAQRQSEIAALPAPPAPDAWIESELRRRSDLLRDADPDRQRRETPDFIAFVLERLCGFRHTAASGTTAASRATAAPRTTAASDTTPANGCAAPAYRPSGAAAP